MKLLKMGLHMKLLVALTLAMSAILPVHASQDASDAEAFAEK